MRKFVLLSFIVGLFLPTATFAGSTNAAPTGPKTVNVGQEFNVVFYLYGAKDVDTFRLHGSFTQDMFEYRASKPTGVFQNVSPGTYIDQANGIFSFGAFTLSSHANGNAPAAVMTFRAKKAGTGYIQLTTNSRVLSAGEDQIGTVGRLTIEVTTKAAPPAQPQPLPSEVSPEELAISLRSTTHPDPDAWYATSTVTAVWELAGKAVKKTYVGFDDSPDGPAEKETDQKTATFISKLDGTWYVHLGVDLKDRTHENAHLRVQIDTVPPHPIVPVTDQTLVPASIPNTLRFAALDDTSGIDHYEVWIDGKFVTSTQLQAYPLTHQTVGKHKVLVKAFDRAGNNVSGTTEYEIVSEIVPIAKRASLLWLWLILVCVVVAVLWINHWIASGKKKKTRRIGFKK
ncbi:cohesin domain-containing protein [Patescibacteria group bacterium]|nr:cohesin domain-containing protein [Patescibacteria group bacterium]MBU1629472.1 cohesin domain-containing protein [Patescibacteria group bacterium]